jgi:hypothetical protein
VHRAGRKQFLVDGVLTAFGLLLAVFSPFSYRLYWFYDCWNRRITVVPLFQRAVGKSKRFHRQQPLLRCQRLVIGLLIGPPLLDILQGGRSAYFIPGLA